jgi:hypothetical protein
VTRYQLRLCVFNVLRRHSEPHNGCTFAGCPDPRFALTRDQYVAAAEEVGERFAPNLRNAMVGWRGGLDAGRHVSVEEAMRGVDLFLDAAAMQQKLKG